MRTLLLCCVALVGCGAPSMMPEDAGVLAEDAGMTEDAGLSVTVHLPDGGAQAVALNPLATDMLEGKTVVRLNTVVSTALPGAALDALQVGFKASDGFDPASRANCMSLVPVSGDKLALGGIETSTRNLTWDDSLGYPGCLYMRDATDLFVTPR